MKNLKPNEPNDEMRSEYDFRGVVRGRHYKPLHEGYTVQVHKADGSITIENYVLGEGAIILAPDVREWFPDTDSVNRALRSLIILIEQMPEKGKLPQSNKKMLTPT